jgi:hypothetical protein
MRNRVAAAGAALLLALAGPLSADEPKTVTIRGETFDVWPTEDLVARGFDMPTVPRELNAAWVYIDAANAFVDLPRSLEDAFDYALDSGWPEGRKDLADYLNQPGNRRAVELVQKASSMDQYRMPYFGQPSNSVIAVILPNLSNIRFLSKLMVADARRLEANKQYDQAMKHHVTVMRMGKHINEGCTLIEGLVGFAVWSLAQRAAVDMVLRQPLSPGQLKKLQHELNQLAKGLPTVDRGLLGERAFGPAMVDELCSRPLHFFANLRGFDFDTGEFGFMSGGVNTNPADGWGELELRVGRLIYPDRIMKRHLLGYYDKVLERAARGPYEAVDMAFDEERYIAERIPKWDVLPRILLPSLSRAVLLGDALTTRVAQARTIVAIRRYMLDHDNEPPPSLQEVADMLPEDAMIDPFSDELLVYRPTAEGWVLYSVGPNLVDDGGQKGEHWDKLDMVYQYPPEPVEPFEQEGDEE